MKLFFIVRNAEQQNDELSQFASLFYNLAERLNLDLG